MSKEVRQDYFEISFYQNLIENFGIPDELQVDVAHLMSHGIIPHGDRNGPLHRAAQNLAWYRDNAGVDIRG